MEAYFQALAGLTLQPNGWAGKMCFIVNGMTLGSACFLIIGLTQFHTMTLPKQISLFTGEELTSLRVVFHANRTAPPENAGAKMTNATFGPKCLEQFERFPHVGLWAKTFSELLIGTGDWYSTRCKLTWKLKGTKCKRLYFQLAPSTPHTDETASGLLPTPTTDQRDRPSERKRKTPNIAAMGAMGFLPTPTAHDFRSTHAENSEAYQNRMQHPRGVPLVEHMQRELDGKSFQLNPRFVAEMMGFPTDWTELPFLSGETKVSRQPETR